MPQVILYHLGMTREAQAAVAAVALLAVLTSVAIVLVDSNVLRVALLFAQAFILVAVGVILAKLTPKK